jgi:hypothetical protein
MTRFGLRVETVSHNSPPGLIWGTSRCTARNPCSSGDDEAERSDRRLPRKGIRSPSSGRRDHPLHRSDAQR